MTAAATHRTVPHPQLQPVIAKYIGRSFWLVMEVSRVITPK